MNEFVGLVLECLHDVWLIACMLWVASCLVPAFQGWLLDGCWLLVPRFKVDVLPQGRPPPAARATGVQVNGVCVCVSLGGCAVVCSCLALLLLVVFVFVAVVAVVCVLLQCLWEVCFDIVDSAL